jgi:hypothetical protein
MVPPPTSEFQASAQPGKPKVIYVMGAGRSGSTILGVTLGNCSKTFDAGELDAWLRRSGVPNFGGSARVQFWDSVRHDVPCGEELFGEQAWRCLEHSLALFRVHGWPARRRLRARYRRIAESLYGAIRRTSGATYIVDTSHYPLRARELQQLDTIDLYLVYLVRNPQHVVASFNRQDVAQKWKSPFVTNAYLWLTHLLSTFVFLRHRRDRRLFLRYEDFIADPSGVLRGIWGHIDASVALPDPASLSTGIPFQGNRLLRSEIISLQSDVPQAPQLLVTSLLQSPWELVFSRLQPTARTSA